MDLGKLNDQQWQEVLSRAKAYLDTKEGQDALQQVRAEHAKWEKNFQRREYGDNFLRAMRVTI